MELSEDFAKKIFEHHSKDSNWVYSPYSIIMSLGMGYLGAAGTTAKEMETAFHFYRI